ncbi:MAG: hypothetical protein XE04_1129 [Marinimicrobia bacterium 46_43]|nr:MAG: hypothetical protein XE04_1129 [Marinimicrobia bacterium 46_43]
MDYIHNLLDQSLSRLTSGSRIEVRSLLIHLNALYRDASNQKI